MLTPPLIPEEINLINAINAYRIQNGVQPLQVSIALTNAARFLANDMATNNFLSHTDSLGRNPFQRVSAFGYTFQTQVGEDIAAGSPSGEVTFEQLRDSCDPDASGNCTFAHRQIMLDPAYQVIGVARAYNPNSTYGYYWVADFGGVVDQTVSITPTPVAIVTPVALPTPVVQTATGIVVTPTVTPTVPIQSTITPTPTTPSIVTQTINPLTIPTLNTNQGRRFGNVIATPTAQSGVFRF